MLDNALLEKIKELEKKLITIQKKEEQLKKLSINLEKNCTSILQVTSLNSSIKNKIKKNIATLSFNLGIDNKDYIFDDQGFLDIESFIKFLSIDTKNKTLFIFKLKNSNEIEFVKSFIISKFTSFISIEENKIIGFLNKDKIKEFENIKFIPYFVDGIYKEIEFFVVFFDIEEINFSILEKCLNIFKRFSLRPSLNEKSFIHYSLKDDMIIDFEALKIKKEEKKFAYLYNMKYPEIEPHLRKEIKNIPFLLVLLDKIDSDLNEIKKSKGTIIVVKRILKFIYRNQMEKSIQEMVKILMKEIED
jgi:hypothetical protein